MADPKFTKNMPLEDQLHPEEISLAAADKVY